MDQWSEIFGSYFNQHKINRLWWQIYNDFMNQIFFFNTTRFVSPQFSYKWDILTFGLHTSGRCHDRTKRSYSSDDPNKLDTWSAKTKMAIKTLSEQQITTCTTTMCTSRWISISRNRDVVFLLKAFPHIFRENTCLQFINFLNI